MFNEREYYWYAVYVRYQHERSVWDFFRTAGIETILPLRQKLIHRNNRFRIAELPLFEGYLFVRISYREHRFILSHPSVIRVVSTAGKPSRIPDHQIEIIKKVMSLQLAAEPAYGPFEKGDKVTITRGPLAGCNGLVQDASNKNRVLLLLDRIGCSLSIDLKDSCRSGSPVLCNSLIC